MLKSIIRATTAACRAGQFALRAPASSRQISFTALRKSESQPKEIINMERVQVRKQRKRRPVSSSVVPKPVWFSKSEVANSIVQLREPSVVAMALSESVNLQDVQTDTHLNAMYNITCIDDGKYWWFWRIEVFGLQKPTTLFTLSKSSSTRLIRASSARYSCFATASSCFGMWIRCSGRRFWGSWRDMPRRRMIRWLWWTSRTGCFTSSPSS